MNTTRFQTGIAANKQQRRSLLKHKRIALRAGATLSFYLFLSSGCVPIQSEQAQPAMPTKTLTLAPSAVITQENSMEINLPSDNPLVVQAIKDLAQQVNLPLNQIKLVSTEAVVWPDGALGCPKEGMMYTQVLQDGMRILLEAGGKTYQYHSGESRPPFLCTNPQ